MNLTKVGWILGFLWIALTAYVINYSPQKLTMKELLLMQAQWCEMTDLNPNSGYIKLSPETTLVYCFTTLMILSICWYFTAEEDVEEMAADVTQVDEDTKRDMIKNDIIEEVLLENTKCLLENVDLEYKHCAATIAANNETPGQKIGGETEWATGETSSEDEDATREITGAKIRKSPRETEDEKIMRFLQEPFENCNTKEPHLRKQWNETDRLNIGKTK